MTYILQARGSVACPDWRVTFECNGLIEATGRAKEYAESISGRSVYEFILYENDVPKAVLTARVVVDVVELVCPH